MINEQYQGQTQQYQQQLQQQQLQQQQQYIQQQQAQQAQQQAQQESQQDSKQFQPPTPSAQLKEYLNGTATIVDKTISVLLGQSEKSYNSQKENFANEWKSKLNITSPNEHLIRLEEQREEKARLELAEEQQKQEQQRHEIAMQLHQQQVQHQHQQQQVHQQQVQQQYEQQQQQQYGASMVSYQQHLGGHHGPLF